MLKGINPLLNPDVLYALGAMGHGDDLILADANFPAEGIARETVLGRILRIDADAPTAAKAVLSLMPLDSFVEAPAARMEVVGSPDEVLPIHGEVQAVIDAAEGRAFPLAGVERFAFYARAAKAFCIIQTAERRFYGCFALRKGVIGPEKA